MTVFFGKYEIPPAAARNLNLPLVNSLCTPMHSHPARGRGSCSLDAHSHCQLYPRQLWHEVIGSLFAWSSKLTALSEYFLKLWASVPWALTLTKSIFFFLAIRYKRCIQTFFLFFLLKILWHQIAFMRQLKDVS